MNILMDSIALEIQTAKNLLIKSMKSGLKNKNFCNWLRRTQPQVIFPDTTIDRFKKAMEEQQ